MTFEQFYRRVWSDGVRWATALTGGIGPGGTVAQEAFARLAGRFDSIDDPDRYLRRTVVSLARDDRRAAQRLSADRPRVVGIPEVEARVRDGPQGLLGALVELPYDQRAALVLRDWAGWDEAAIADALGCRRASVRAHARRGIDALRSEARSETDVDRPSDEQLTRRMRGELDDLIADAPGPPPSLPGRGTTLPPAGRRRRSLAVGVVAGVVALLVGLVLLADREQDNASSPTTPPTPPPASSDGAPVVPVAAVYETVATVLEGPEHGPQLCLGAVTASSPPQCEGLELSDWSWDAVDGEQSEAGTTWIAAYVTGSFNPDTGVFAVDSARPADAADSARLPSSPPPDFSVPCPVPPGGWPPRTQEWPGEQVSAIAGYAGAWVDPTQQVVTVKFTGDLAAAEAAVREHYVDALCVAPATRTHTELLDIQARLTTTSNVQVLWSAVLVDAAGERVEIGIIAPDPVRQAALDEEFGAGVVRLVPQLYPL